jgi:CRP-like cAMP-binding protein
MVTLFDQLGAATQNRLIEVGQPASFTADQFLIRDGDSSQDVFLINDGLAKVVKSSMEGRVTFVALRGPGCLVGELSMLVPSPRSASVQAVADTSATRFSFDQFRRLLVETPELTVAMLSDVSAKLQEATDQIHDLSAANAVTRMASRLVRLAAEASPPTEVSSITLTLPVSQQELGEWAGLSRAATAGALGQLRDAGLIETSRMAITINDIDRLGAMAHA